MATTWTEKSTGSSFLVNSTEVDVRGFATGGNGTSSNPWTGWEASVNALAPGKVAVFVDQYFRFSTGLTVKAGQSLKGAGTRSTFLEYSGDGTAITVNDQYVRVRDFKLSKSGSAGSSIGIEVATGSNTGHNLGISNLEVTGFDTGLKTSRTLYANYYGVDSHDNITHNWLFTNTTISVDLHNCSGRGGAKYGITVDSTTANSAEVRLHGCTFEGASIQQIDIVGADRVLINDTHVEPNSPTALTGTVTLSNGSTSMTGSGTLFTSELVVGQYVKLNTDSATAWMRIESITGNTTATLSDPYQGTGGSGAAKKAAGGIRIANLGAEAAERCLILNPSMSIQSESAPAIYVQSGNDNIIMTGDASMPIILGSSAVRTQVWFSRASGGFVDLGTDSRVYGDPSQGQFYVKRGTVKAFQLWVSGSETELYSDQKWRLYVGGVNQLIVDPGTATDEIGLQVKDYAAGILKRVSRGPADSGGTGFRVLRVPN